MRLTLIAILTLAACHRGDQADRTPEAPIANVAPPDAAPAVASPEPDPEPDELMRGPESEDDVDTWTHFERAREAFDHGDYRRAIDEFTLAYEYQPRPELLYNLATAYRLLGDRANAISYYRRYLGAAPDARNAATVQQIIDALQQQSP